MRVSRLFHFARIDLANASRCSFYSSLVYRKPSAIDNLPLHVKGSGGAAMITFIQEEVGMEREQVKTQTRQEHM